MGLLAAIVVLILKGIGNLFDLVMKSVDRHGLPTALTVYSIVVLSAVLILLLLDGCLGQVWPYR